MASSSPSSSSDSSVVLDASPDSLPLSPSMYEPLVEVTRKQRRLDLASQLNGKSLVRRQIEGYLSAVTKRVTSLLSLRWLFAETGWYWVCRVFPVVPTIASYPNDWKKKLTSDIVAGISIALILIPQSLSYSTVAGLPPIYGLYSSIVPIFMYAIFGTCHQLGVGPVAVVSIITGESIQQITTDSTRFPALANYAALLVGIFNLGFGIFNLGFLMRLLSPAFITAFISASAFTIGASQLGALFGYKTASSSIFWQELQYFFADIDKSLWVPPLIGIFCGFVIVFVKKKAPRVPIAFLLMVTFTVIAYLMDSPGIGNVENLLPVVGALPQGFPSFVFPTVTSDEASQLVGSAVILTFIGYMESYSLALKMGEKHKYKVRPSQEFIALGVANFLGSCFGAYPCTGSFSRTAEADSQGARTILYSILTACIMVMAVSFLTPAFYYIPKSVLSGVIIAAVSRLVHFEDMVHYYKQSSMDFFVWWVTFIGVLIAGTENGLAIGVGFSFLIVLLKLMFPYIALLGSAKIADGSIRYLNMKRFPSAKPVPRILVFRFDNALYFFNKDYFEEQIEKRLGIHDESTVPYPIEVFILDGAGMPEVDAGGATQLYSMVHKLRGRGISTLFVNIRSHVKDVLIDGNMMDEIDPSNFYLTVEDAVMVAKRIIANKKRNPPIGGRLSDTSPLPIPAPLPDQNDVDVAVVPSERNPSVTVSVSDLKILAVRMSDETGTETEMTSSSSSGKEKKKNKDKEKGTKDSYSSQPSVRSKSTPSVSRGKMRQRESEEQDGGWDGDEGGEGDDEDSSLREGHHV